MYVCAGGGAQLVSATLIATLCGHSSWVTALVVTEETATTAGARTAADIVRVHTYLQL